MRISDWSSDVCSSDLISVDAQDLGAEGFHGALAVLAHLRVDVDAATAAGQPRAPGHRAAVVAVGRRGHGDRRRSLGVAALADLVEADGMAECRFQALREKM